MSSDSFGGQRNPERDNAATLNYTPETDEAGEAIAESNLAEKEQPDSLEPGDEHETKTDRKTENPTESKIDNTDESKEDLEENPQLPEYDKEEGEERVESSKS
jgi:hypothetical protein